MPGGIIQMVTYGSQDLFLTGTPEITFFKVVYRRHTNFATESIEVNFDDPYGFDQVSNLIVPKVGDLIGNVYVKIILPELRPKRSIITPSNSEIVQMKLYYSYIRDFMDINIQGYRVGIIQCDSINTSENSVVTSIEESFNSLTETIRDNYILAINNTPFRYSTTCIQESLQSLKISGILKPGVTKTIIRNIITMAINKSVKLCKYYHDKITTLEKTYQDQINPYAKIAWIKNIGHNIIDYVSVSIGGTEIDKHYGIWLDIWHKLTCDVDKSTIYNKMIGNVDQLIVPTRNGLPSYTLYIPLQFWFCRHSGLALPLIALQYNDVNFTIKFRKFEELIYIDELTQTELNDPILRANKINDLNINLTSENIMASFLIDFIYLDNQERKKFAQSSHEYLIEQIQLDDNFYGNKPVLQYSLNFTLSSKELIWVSICENNTTYTDGFQQLLFTDYTTNNINPIVSANILFNSETRCDNFKSEFYNYIQSYTHHTSSSPGINVFSFALHPQEFQPSGMANLSKIEKITLNLLMNPTLINSGLSFNTKVFSLNYNILRFASGFGALAIVS